MKIQLTIILIFSTVLSLNSQIDSAFWNPKMLKLAETNSHKGWVRIKPEINYNAKTFFTENKDAFGLNMYDEMKFKSSHTDELGLTHYKFQQYHKGVKVENCEYILHEKSGKTLSANGYIANELEIQTIPNISELKALDIAMQKVNATKYEWEEPTKEDNESLPQYPRGELIVARIKNNGDFSNENFRLTYRFTITSLEPSFSRQAIYVDAINGVVVKNQNLINDDGPCVCCEGATTTLYNGYQNITTDENPLFWIQGPYHLLDECRGNGIETVKTGYNNLQIVKDQNNYFMDNHQEIAAASAHWAAGMTYDYFQEFHNRNSYDNNGGYLRVITGYPNEGASWIGDDNGISIIRLGVGNGINANNDWVSLDVVGHEFTHGVIDYSANLVYSSESGALNESFADIFGTMVEYYAQNGDGNYLISEEFYIPDGKLRDMSNPNSKSHPDTYGGNFWANTNCGPTYQNDYCGVHTNSGVQNYWFYLLAEGNTGVNDLGNSYNVQGIGREKASQIAYRNLTVYLTSASDFSDAKNGAIWSAMDLYGPCSNEVMQTIKAWDAVGVTSIGGINYNTTVDCPTLNYIHNQGIPFTARAINYVQSDCEILQNSNAQVTFIAGSSITLQPGFYSGPDFYAFIDPCLSFIELKMADNTDDDTPKYTLHSPTNINEELRENNISNDNFEVSPNPSKGEISITLQEMDSYNAHLNIYDSQGKMILSRYITNRNTTIDLTNNKKGVYYVSLICNNQLHSKKIVLN